MILFLPTPIGNLEDISYRAVRALQEAEILFCEDTRVTKRLISLLQDKFQLEFSREKEYISLHSHNEYEKLCTLDLEVFSKNCVYVSDAGTPCISDPGTGLIEFCQKNSIKYDVLPGANALLPAYAMSGFKSKEFIFFGFLHNTGKERLKEIKNLLNMPYPTIVYESPKRVFSLVEEISKLQEGKELFLVKEISKLNQRYFKGTAKDLLETLKESNLKGEWVVVIEKSEKESIDSEMVTTILELEISLKDKSKILGKLTDKPSKHWYKELLN